MSGAPPNLRGPGVPPGRHLLPLEGRSKLGRARNHRRDACATQSFLPRRGTRAFSLIEVLAALLIFSVAIMAILEGQSQSLATQSSLMDRFKAQTLAENRLEEILLSGDLFEGEEEGEYEGEDARFTWVTSILESTTVGLVEVVVAVRWKERGSEREVRLATYASQSSS